MQLVLDGVTYEYSRARSRWLDPKGEPVDVGIHRECEALFAEECRKTELGRLDAVDKLFADMSGQTERASALRWLAIRYDVRWAMSL